MIRTERRLRLCACLLACNLIFIWGNSLLPGAVSQAFSDWVRALLGLHGSSAGGFGGNGPDLIRKAAHFTEFCTLGMLLTWLMGMLGKNHRLALALSVAVACVDETIQVFTPERGPGLKDVALDSCGAAVGMFLLWAGHNYWNKIHNLEETEK